jgi:hypothetical protein
MFCQGLVLRESLYARHEAELAAGLALAAWLLASGLGGLLAARAAGSRAWWASTIALLGLVAPAAAWLCRAHAIDPALASSVSGLLAGAAFAMPFGKGAGIAAVCAAEAAGALLGGVLFSALSASMLLGGLALSAVVLSMGAAAVSGWIPAALALLAATAAVFAGLPGRLDRLAVLGGPASSCDSFTTRPGARGEVVVAWRSGQATLWRSGRVESYRSAPEAAELLSMVPLAYSGEGRILYLGNSPDVASLLTSWAGTDVVVPDSTSRAIVEAAAPRASCLVGDERRAVEDAECAYGLVIFHAGLPMSLLSNRMYTREFFRSSRRALSPAGVLAFTLPLGQTRLVPEQAAILGPILAAGRMEFRHCLVLPLGGALVIFSEDSLRDPSSVVGERWGDLRSLNPVFFDSASLQWELGHSRAASWAAGFDPEGWTPNSDLRPRAFTAASVNWETRMGHPVGGMALRAVLGAAVLLLCISATLMGRRAAVAVFPFALGASSAACETAAILIVQATLGISWAVIALAPALFMCGYAIGSAALRFLRPWVSGIAGSASVAALAVVCISYDTGSAGPGALAAGSAAAVLLTGLFAGAAFPPSASALGGSVKDVVLVNAVSAAGGAAGAVVFPLFLFPSMGAASTLMWTGTASFVLCLLAAPFTGTGSAEQG